MTAKRIAFNGSVVVASVGVFALLNVAFAVFTMIVKKNSGAYAEQSGVYQAIDSAIKQFAHTTPDVVLLGSSLIMSPVWSADFFQLGPKEVEGFYEHHHFKMLENLLSERAHRHIQVFSFALPGAMVSDMFLVVDKLMKPSSFPPIVIYGVGPRDFMDNLSPYESDTPVFLRLGTIGDLFGPVYSTLEPSALFQTALERCCFLYGKRNRYQARMKSYCVKTATKLIPRLAISEGNLEDADAKNSDRIAFSGDPQVLWKRSEAEYAMHYLIYSKEKIKRQSKFLECILHLCRLRNAKVVLLNMPLTEANRRLMPAGMYDDYLSIVGSISNRYSIKFIDLSSSEYSNACFYDTAHLNQNGSKLFTRDLARILTPQIEY